MVEMCCSTPTPVSHFSSSRQLVNVNCSDNATEWDSWSWCRRPDFPVGVASTTKSRHECALPQVVSTRPDMALDVAWM